MLIYSKGDFLEDEHLSNILNDIMDKNPDSMEDCFLAAGFFSTDKYYYNNIVDGMGIEVYGRSGGVKSELSDKYAYLVVWFSNDFSEDVLIKNIPDLYEFLGKHLPTIKLAGELSLNENSEP